MTEPALGDFAVVATGGWPSAVIRWVTRSKVNHAVLYIGNGYVVEGEPAGARVTPVSNYGDKLIWANWPLTDEQRPAVAAWGKAHIGTPYSWLDDAAIGLADLFHWVPGILRKRLASTSTLMCSQLVDAAYAAAGVQLFPDGRPAGAVSPGDLYTLIQTRNGGTAVKKPSDWWW